MASANKDKLLGLTATVPTNREKVVFAIHKAGEIAGKKIEFADSSSKIIISFFPGLIRATSLRSPVAVADLAPQANNIVINLQIQTYKQIRPRFFMIPVGAGRIVGINDYKGYIRALEQEFKYLNGVVQHLGAW